MCNPVTTHNPDALLLKGTCDGFDFEVTHNGLGFRCGYVRVPAGHPWHGKGYDEIDADVHGGLTFAEPDADCGTGGGDSAWWVGFDCAHYTDAPDPGLSNSFPQHMLTAGGTVKTTEYVAEECRQLARQAGNASSGVIVVPDIFIVVPDIFLR